MIDYWEELPVEVQEILSVTALLEKNKQIAAVMKSLQHRDVRPFGFLSLSGEISPAGIVKIHT